LLVTTQLYIEDNTSSTSGNVKDLKDLKINGKPAKTGAICHVQYAQLCRVLVINANDQA